MTSEEISNAFEWDRLVDAEANGDKLLRFQIAAIAEIAYQLAVKNEQEAARFNFWIGLMEKIADKINAEKEKAAL